MATQTYDPDADKAHAPQTAGSHDSLGVHPEHAEAETAALEKQFAADSAAEPGYGKGDKSPNSEQIQNKEEEAAEPAEDTVGSGYKPSRKEKRFNAAMGSNSKLRKRIAIAGAAAGGSFILGGIVFLALLPLKIEHVMNNLDSKFSAAATNAIGTETDNMYAQFIKQRVMPNLGKGACHSTVDASCVSLVNGSTNPVDKLFNAWKQGNLEQKLAQKFDIVIGFKNGQYYMNMSGFFANDSEMKEVKAGTRSVFDLTDSRGTQQVTRNEIRTYLHNSLKEGTLWDKTYTRFVAGKLLESKYGIKRCILACNIKDKYADTVANKKLAAKGYIIQRVISPLSESYGLILQCIIGGGSTCDTTPDGNSNADPNDPERTSAFQRQLQTQLDAFAEKFGSEALTSLLSDAKDLSEKGFTRYLVGKIATKLGVQEGTDKALDSALPVIGWVNFGATLVDFLNKAGPALKALNYVAGSAAAAQLYMSYRTVADEAKSGHTDPTELGSFANTLADDTQLDGKGGDMSSTPLFANLMGSNTTTSASIFSSMFGSASAVSSVSSYKCKDGNGVPSGKLVCDEEQLNGGNKVASAISSFVNSIPGWGILTTVASIWDSTIKPIYNLVGTAIGDVLSYIPGIDQIGKLVAPLMDALTKWLLPSPFSDNMTGGRTFDMLAAGSDVSANSSCMIQLGCAVASPTAVAKIQAQEVAYDKAAFQNQSMFARMFDTSSQYSLISSIAMAMPTSFLTATDTTASSLISDPLGKFGSLFTSIFSTNQAFAAPTATPDPFGITQVAYPTVPTDPQAYWDQNCQGDYTTPWLNKETVDPNTGQAVATQTNACMLINRSIQSAGGSSDPSLLPPDTTASSTTPTPVTGGGSIAAYKDPLRTAHINNPERIDQGVDYSATGYLSAIGTGTIVHTADSGWPGGWFTVEQLNSGPAAGKYVYYSEDCSATVSVGQVITSVDTKICDLFNGGDGIELGWAQPPGSGWYAIAHNEYTSDGLATSYGQNYNQLMVKLGAPSGNLSGGSGSSGVSKAALPAGWPTW